MGLSFLSSELSGKDYESSSSTGHQMCSDVSAELMVSSSKKLGFCSLSVFVLVGVYGTYWQLTLAKPHTSRLAFIEKMEVFTETFASFSHKSTFFYWIETSECSLSAD